MTLAASPSHETLPPPLGHVPSDVSAVMDYEPYARARLNPAVWAYLTGGAGDEVTLRDNQASFDRWRLSGRVLQPVAGGHTRISLLGSNYAHPLLLAPIGCQVLFHPEGELASTVGAGVMEAGMVVSSLASMPIETLAAHARAPLWWQLYFQQSRAATQALLKRAEAAGCVAIVVTVDAPLSGVRHRERRAGFIWPARLASVNLPAAASSKISTPPPAPGSLVFDQLMRQAPDWSDIAWLTQTTSLPVLVKGILHPDDALKALAAGAAGIVVSNHGGRILDGLPATLDALPAVAAACAGRVPVLFDGGIRRGADVFKALALGARAVLIGRAYVHALAAAGALGVAHALRTLREELEITMALSGCATLDDIGPAALHFLKR